MKKILLIISGIFTLLGFLCFASAEKHAETKSVEVIETRQPPIIDGNLEDPAWKEAKWNTGFSLLGKPEQLSKNQTAFAVIYDEKNLYIAIKAYESHMDKLVAKKYKRDNRNWSDDSIEIFINPHIEQQNDYFFFAISCLGSIFDASVTQAGILLKRGWNINCKTAAGRGENYWTIEMSIPFYGFDIGSNVSTSWGFNIARNRRGSKPDSDGVSHTFNPLPTGGYQQPDMFGKLVGFRKEILMAYSYELDKMEFKSTEEGENGDSVCLQFEIKNTTGKNRKLTAAGYFIPSEGKIITEKISLEISKNQKKKVSLGNYLLSKEGLYKVIINIKDTNYNTICVSRQSEYNLILSPITVEMLCPQYRNTIYASYPYDNLIMKVNFRGGVKAKKLIAEIIAKDSGKVLDSKNYTIFKKEGIKIVFPVKSFPYGNYLVKLKLFNNTGSIIYETSEPLYKLPHAKGSEVVIDNINHSRAVVINGKPEYIKGWYQVYPHEMKDFSASGYNIIMGGWACFPENCFQGQRIRSLLDAAAKHGLKVVFSPYPSWSFIRRLATKEVTHQELDQIKKCVNEFKNHPALFGWYIADEPEGGDVIPKELEKVYKIIRETDPYHPCILVSAAPDGQYTYRKCADILAPDVYVFYHADRKYYDLSKDRIVNSVNIAMKSGNDKGAVFVIPQGFIPRAFKPAWKDMRSPSFSEMRLMTYLGIVLGTTGTVFYHYISPFTESPVKKIGVDRFILKELKYLQNALLSKENPKLKVFSKNDKVHALLKKYNNELYLIAVNPGDKACKATFEIPGLNENTEFNVVSEKRSVIFDGKKFKDLFVPNAVHIYTNAPKLPDTDLKKTIAEIKSLERSLHKPGNIAFEMKPNKNVTFNYSSWQRHHMAYLVSDGITTGKSVWQDATQNSFPDWIELTFSDEKTVSRIVIYTPNLKDYEIQISPDGKSWQTIDKVVNNTQTQITHKFEPVKLKKIRVFITDVNKVENKDPNKIIRNFMNKTQNGYSRIYEIEAYEK